MGPSGSLPGELAHDRVVDLVRGGQRLRPPQRPRPAADGPGVLPGLLRPRDRARSWRSSSSGPFALDWTGSSIFAVVWLGLLGSGLAYLCFFWLLARWGSTRSSMVAYLLPVVGIVLGFLVLNETIDARVLLGTALVVGGVALVNSPFGQRRLFGRRGARRRPNRRPAGPA